MCEHHVRKFVSAQDAADKRAAERRRRERELAAGILAALTWLKSQTFIIGIGFIAPAMRNEFDAELSKALGPAFAIHDLGGDSLDMGFDALDPATVAREQAYRTHFVREFSDETVRGIATAQQWMARNAVDGEIASRLLSDAAGLNNRQVKAVLAMLQSWMATQTPMARVERLFDKAAQRYRTARSLLTADTEGWRAWNLGQMSGADQVRQRGATVTVFWEVTPDEFLCPVCAAIPSMNPDGVPLGQKFRSPVGDIAMPPDPHPKCRCKQRFEFS
jgi:hypothetical protein